jgi:hypothetical protein
MNRVAVTVAAVASVVLLTTAGACGQTSAYDDKTNAKGERVGPDVRGEVDWTEVYLNVDGVPTIAFTCVKGLGFASPASSYRSGETSGGGGSPLIRVPEQDTFCATKKKS